MLFIVFDIIKQMEILTMCRICQMTNVRMHSILNTNLQEMYEKLTTMPLETKDSRPLHVCYICCAKLQNCHQLQIMCLQSEELFTQMIVENMPPQSSPAKNRLKVTQWINISIEPDNPDYSTDDDANLSYINVKTEPIDITKDVKVKEEHIENAAALSSKKRKLPELGDNSRDVITRRHRAVITVAEIQAQLANSKKEAPDKNNVASKTDCVACGKCFTNKSHLMRHMRRHTGEQSYKCDICGKRFSEKVYLNTHIRLHTGEKPYKCDICKKCFIQRRDLRNHNRVHTGEKPCKCDVCEKGFNQTSDLRRHMRIHTGEKPYKCDICDRCFTQTNDLTKHIRTHTGEKPYKCSTCEKSFSQKNSLNTHIRVHTGEKPYKCEVCEKYFSRKGHLFAHIRIHTGQKPYICVM